MDKSRIILSLIFFDHSLTYLTFRNCSDSSINFNCFLSSGDDSINIFCLLLTENVSKLKHQWIDYN